MPQQVAPTRTPVTPTRAADSFIDDGTKRSASPDDSGPRLSRMGSTLEKYQAGKLVSWDEAKARILGKR